jgi:hypothetical protein
MKTLTWKVTYTKPTACPDYKPDPYTGQYPGTHCLVYHCETVTDSKTADFETEQKALDFASKAPTSCFNFKLDGTEIEDKRPKTDNIISLTLTGNSAGTVSPNNYLTPTGIN